MHVRKKGADTCTDCGILLNEFRVMTEKQRSQERLRDEAARRAEARDDEDDDGNEEGEWRSSYNKQ
jgi:hypothetical protein